MTSLVSPVTRRFSCAASPQPQLQQHRCIAHRAWTAWNLRCGGDYRWQLPLAHTTDNLLYARECAIAGAGITLLPAFLSRRWWRRSCWWKSCRRGARRRLELYLVYPSRKLNSPALACFIDGCCSIRRSTTTRASWRGVKGAACGASVWRSSYDAGCGSRIGAQRTLLVLFVLGEVAFEEFHFAFILVVQDVGGLIRSRNQRSCEITMAQPGEFQRAFSSARRVSISRSLVGSSRQQRCRQPAAAARCRRPRSPPDNSPSVCP